MSTCLWYGVLLLDLHMHDQLIYEANGCAMATVELHVKYDLLPCMYRIVEINWL